jgi:hypothetical protein
MYERDGKIFPEDDIVINKNQKQNFKLSELGH